MHRKSFLRSVKDLDRTKINVIGRDEAVPRAIPDALEEVQEMGSVTVDVAVDTGCDFVVPAELGKACHFFRFVEGRVVEGRNDPFGAGRLASLRECSRRWTSRLYRRSSWSVNSGMEGRFHPLVPQMAVSFPQRSYYEETGNGP